MRRLLYLALSAYALRWIRRRLGARPPGAARVRP
jgi:hypothetical protein